MKTLNLFVAVFAMIALVVLTTAAASAFATNVRVTVNGIENFGGTSAVFAGETMPVRVLFDANANEDNVQVTARLRGYRGFSELSSAIAVLAGGPSSPL